MIFKKDNIEVAYDAEQGETYQLRPTQQTRLWRFLHVLRALFIFPLRAVQFFLGRFLAYAIFNPLFRQLDRDAELLAQPKKFPDPVFTVADDLVVVSIFPELGFFRRILNNWMHAARTNFNAIFSLNSNHDAPFSTARTDERRVEEVITKVRSLLHNKEGKARHHPHQIHFKGLYHLTPTQRTLLLKRLTDEYHHDFKQHSKKYNFFILRNAAGDELDSVEILGPSVAHQAMSERKFIVSCLPRSGNYTPLLRQHHYFANQLNATVVAFNYRGTSKSRGLIANQRDMRADVMAHVERLIAMGAKPENIALMGECLGANIATHVAATLHQRHCPVKLMNIRSFRSASALILGFFLPSKKASKLNPVTWVKYGVAASVAVVVIPLLYLAGWDLSVERAFKSIPAKDREFLAVRSKKDARGQRNRDDRMVSHHYASVYSLFKEEQQALKAKFASGKKLSEEEQTRLNDPRGMHKFCVDSKKRRDARHADGHTVHLRYLAKTKTPSSPEDGREFVLNFFRKTWSKRSVSTQSENSAPACDGIKILGPGAYQDTGA